MLACLALIARQTGNCLNYTAKKCVFCYLINVIIQAALYVEYQALSTGRCMYIVCCAWTKLITWCNEWSHTCSCGGRPDMGCVRSYMHTHTHTHTEREREITKLHKSV